ncbi:AAA family ATPase [Sandaracinobacteroides saxicola]|uniref:ATP-binding protein n=1 Tax=Sandaracinobacteroides saxicola TaxID=2759707 RepID=A0A7G5ILT6_9SPHN|nr:ATP-binding protein [Sandaracinobacteroides saxicola]QMW24328.1 ATP-binding protein [Sandaracinobacteroides saxicola]
MLVEIIIGAIGESALGYAGQKSVDLFKSGSAKKEIAEIGSRSIEAGVLRAPALAADLRSVSFVNGVFVPILQTMIIDPSKLPDPDGLASEFVAMFVERFAGGDSADDTLKQIFQTEPAELKDAFAAMIRELRSQFYQSKHWREVGHFSAIENTLKNTDTIIEILHRQQRASDADAVDVEDARKDAKAGSDELRSWPRDIKGRELLRPELERLKNRIASERSGSTLLIGEAGSGKSALLSKLTDELEAGDFIVFGIKADTLPPTVATFDDVGRALGMVGPLADELHALARVQPVVLIIDQLDAVSDVMDRSSDRMKVLLRLVRNVRDRSLPVHVIVSSRPFEASHDARFQQLRAEEIILSLPSVENVLTFLTLLGIDGDKITVQLRETLRRPFALKLFVDLVSRGIGVDDVASGELLNMWLATADLGNDQSRQAVLRLMEKLVNEMMQTETLWRPLDAFVAEHKDALAIAEAAGLLVRNGLKVGFSHQSWLDDFQAKSFKTGTDLAKYAWQNQDSLFVRGTLLRALQRLRHVDEISYGRAVSALLWQTKTRRHVKHLIVDVIATVRLPTLQEGAWVEALIQSDPILANRALGKLADHWLEWRSLLGKCLGILMTSDEFHWTAIRLLAGEARLDADSVVKLIGQHWDQPEKDGLVFRVVEQSGIISDAVENLVKTILGRTKIEEYAISHFVSALRGDGRFREAARIVSLWFSALETDRRQNPSLHNVQKLADAAPREFAEELLDAFIVYAAKDVGAFNEGYKRYPKSQSLSWDWDFDRERDNVLEAFRDAVNGFAQIQPDVARPYLSALAKIEIEQAQEIVAHAYIASAEALAADAAKFLLADERRLCLGDAHVQLEPGMSSIESGLTSQELIEVIAPHLPDRDVEKIRDRIEQWSLYGPEFNEGDEPSLRLKRLKWADENRIELLKRLPDRFLSSQRKRQVAERRASRKWPVSRKRGGMMASFVGSPMAHTAMLKARDDDIFKMLDEINDTSEGRSRRRPISMDGGVVELSRAFAEFGKEQPQRAIVMARTKFVAGRHEHAAAELVHKLTEGEDYAADELLALIHELSDRGFSSDTWKTFASWSLARIAGKISGLPDNSIAMMKGWLENDPAKIAKDIEDRLDLEARNEERNKREREMPQPFLFHAHGLHGMRIVPQDNFSILDAIFKGLIAREERDYEQWISILEEQAKKDEDPHIWSFLLCWQSDWLYWADRDRVQALIRALWDKDRRIFQSVELVGVLWKNRPIFPDHVLIEIITAWFETGEEPFVQAAAEYTQAMVLVHPDNPIALKLRAHLTEEASWKLTGQLFTAASAWRDGDTVLRPLAHQVLMKFAPNATGEQAHALSSAVDKRDTLSADDLTRELVNAVAENQELLAASLTGRFADGLQSLLLYPGFDEPVMHVTERMAELIVDKKGGQHRGFIDKDFVQVSIALQRNDGPLRARAMDVYEKLLDAGAYGAEEAAKEVIRN